MTALRYCLCLICTARTSFKTGGVDGCYCAEILSLIEKGLIDTTPLITHRYSLADIEEAYRVFQNRESDVIKVL